MKKKIKFININKLRKKFLLKSRSEKYQKKSIKTINGLLDIKYNYLFDWMGIPVIQFPNDMLVLQELIYKLKPKYFLSTMKILFQRY